MDVELLRFVSVLVLGFGAVSRRAKHSPVAPPMAFVSAGLLAALLTPTDAALGQAVVSNISALGLAVLAFAAAELAGGNGFIAAFVAGLTLGNRWHPICECLHEFGEAEGQLLALCVFLAFGAIMVPEALAYLTPETALYALVSLTVVRMLPVALALLGTGLHAPSIAFLGWFGPRGLASILFGLLIVEEERLANAVFIQSVVVLTVRASTFLHGLTAYPPARRYGRWLSALKAR